VPQQLGAAPAGAAGSGSGSSTVLAVIFGLLMAAVVCFSKLLIAPAIWRSVALVSLTERPG
jgi:ABC-type uncharacterized transport system YnjBCD ATPase subunit